MKHIESRGGLDGAESDSTRGLRRIIVTAELVLVGLILIVVAMYAGAFIIRADDAVRPPMWLPLLIRDSPWSTFHTRTWSRAKHETSP